VALHGLAPSHLKYRDSLRRVTCRSLALAEADAGRGVRAILYSRTSRLSILTPAESRFASPISFAAPAPGAGAEQPLYPPLTVENAGVAWSTATSFTEFTPLHWSLGRSTTE
jgi:hypothetical protein